VQSEKKALQNAKNGFVVLLLEKVGKGEKYYE